MNTDIILPGCQDGYNLFCMIFLTPLVFFWHSPCEQTVTEDYFGTITNYVGSLFFTVLLITYNVQLGLRVGLRVW